MPIRQQPKRRYFYIILLCLLLVGVVPLAIAGVFSGVFTRSVLAEQGRTEASARANRALLLIDAMLQEYARIVDTLASDPGIRQAFSHPDSITPAANALLYDKVFMLLSGKSAKPAIHLLDGKGRFALSTTSAPRGYDPVQYASWGIFRRALAADGSPIFFPQGLFGKVGDPASISIARYVRLDAYNGFFVILDLGMLHFKNTLSPLTRSDRFSIIVASSNEIPVFAEGPEVAGIYERMRLFENKPADTPCAVSVEMRDGETAIIARSTPASSGLYVYVLSELSERIHGSRIGVKIFLSAAMAIGVLCIAIALLLARSVTGPVYTIIGAVSRVREGDLSTRINLKRTDELGLLADNIDLMSEQLETLVGNIKRQERSVRIAELEALQAQIKPHFIFNCLEVIRLSARMGKSEEVASTVVTLGKLLRSSMQNEEILVTILEEWNLLKAYASIQQRRFEDRLSLELFLDPAIETVKIPKLIIQPLVENALVHGLEGKVGKGRLVVSATASGSGVSILIEDDGVGMDAATKKHCFDGEIHEAEKTGIGVRNVLGRLRLHYGSEFSFSITSALGAGTKIVIVLPSTTKELL